MRLHEANEEMRKVTVERKAEAEGLRSLTRQRVFWANRHCLEPKALKVKPGSLLWAVPGRRRSGGAAGF